MQALPSLVIPDYRVTVYYHFDHNITIRPLIPLVGDCNLLVAVEDASLVQVLTPSVPMRATGSGDATVTIRHINPGFTKLRLTAIAAGPQGSNYHNSELIIVLTLNYPGFEIDNRECVWGGAVGGCSALVLHVQRFQNKALTGTSATRGTARIYLTPNEKPDAPTYINMDNSGDAPGQPSFILVQSRDRVLAGVDNSINGEGKRNTWATVIHPDTVLVSKYFQATHQGNIGTVTLRFSSPQSGKWPEASGCVNADLTCLANNNNNMQ